MESNAKYHTSASKMPEVCKANPRHLGNKSQTFGTTRCVIRGILVPFLLVLSGFYFFQYKG